MGVMPARTEARLTGSRDTMSTSRRRRGNNQVACVMLIGIDEYDENARSQDLNWVVVVAFAVLKAWA